MSASFAPPLFFPAPPATHTLAADLDELATRFRLCVSDKQRSGAIDEHLRTDVSVLYGEKHA